MDTLDGKVIDLKRKGPFKPFKNEKNNGGKLRNIAIFAEEVITAFDEATNLLSAILGK